MIASTHPLCMFTIHNMIQVVGVNVKSWGRRWRDPWRSYALHFADGVLFVAKTTTGLMTRRTGPRHKPSDIFFVTDDYQRLSGGPASARGGAGEFAAFEWWITRRTVVPQGIYKVSNTSRVRAVSNNNTRVTGGVFVYSVRIISWSACPNMIMNYIPGHVWWLFDVEGYLLTSPEDNCLCVFCGQAGDGWS